MMAAVERGLWPGLSSAAVTIPVCVLAGEAIAGGMARLERIEVALQREQDRADQLRELDEMKDTFRLPLWLGFCVFLAIAVFFLWEEHSAHILGAVPYLLLLACPLLHIISKRFQNLRR